MRSTNRPGSARDTGFPRAIAEPARPRTLILRISVLIPLYALLLSGATPEKHLSVYSLAANYSLPLVQRDGRDYVGLLELLEPLGRVSAKSESSRWRLRYNHVEGIFLPGSNRAQIQDRDIDLGGRFQMENKLGIVPVSSLSTLLPRFLGGPVSLREDSDRLFIGNIATHFTASLSSDTPPRLVFRFTAPVNPSVATEPGALRMTFSHEPLVGPASPTLTFGSKAISSASYAESNGSAVVTVNSTIPVMASFANDGRTIAIIPTTAAAQTNPSAAQTPPGTNSAGAAGPANTASPTPTTSASTPVSASPSPRRYFAVVDASHGGDDHGETLSSSLLEKDVTLTLAHSLRQELESRGITTLVLRDSDANLSLDQRAAFVNADRASLYVALHAASSGRGVRVYSALLPVGDDDHGPFFSWTTAQRMSLPLSQSTAAAVAGELQKRQIPVRALSAPLRPLNNITGPAIAVEVAPQGSDVSQLTASDYQQLVTSAVASAIAATRDALGAAQ